VHGHGHGNDEQGKDLPKEEVKRGGEARRDDEPRPEWSPGIFKPCMMDDELALALV
jgi:hypothetical protein